jgi:predicted peroxiredoxin
MAGKFVVSCSRAKDDEDRATVSFTLANAAVGSDQETVVFLASEGTRLAVEGYADDIHVEGLSALKELMTNFAAAGGKIYVCLPCFQKRGLDESNLVDGAVIVGGTALVAFMADGAASVSF